MYTSPFAAHGSYHSPQGSPSWLARLCPSLMFYGPLLGILIRAGLKARANLYTGEEWSASSESVTALLEKVGCTLHIEGMEHFQKLDGPCVFVGNHMSTLETFVLPGLIQPWKNVSFVVKTSLYKYPVFSKVLASRNPIVVNRTNPREDLALVLNGGAQRLHDGQSIIVFPQSTRSASFDRTLFNTIGVKLAKKAAVPVVPFALKTNAWGNGTLLKDFGAIRTDQTIHFRFGEPVSITGNGKEEHRAISDFVEQTLSEWTR